MGDQGTYLSMSANALQTSILVRTRRITSYVNSVVVAWPPGSAVLMPSEAVSRAASYTVREARRGCSRFMQPSREATARVIAIGVATVLPSSDRGVPWGASFLATGD